MKLTHRKASPEEIKTLIRRIRPVERAHDFPAGVDIDELFHDPEMCDHALIWIMDDGEPCAYAFIHFPYNNLNFESADETWTDTLEDEVIAWAQYQMRKQYQDDLVENTLDSNCRYEDTRMTRFFERHGFLKDKIESLDYELVMSEMPKLPDLPEGFTVRPLKPDVELGEVVELHQAAHGTQNFTLDDRVALMSTAEYLPELDLVVETPDGKLAGNCICGVTTSAGLLEGYTDPVVVHPNYQSRGLARALIQAGLAGLFLRGVRCVRLGTSSKNIAMQRAAQASGFSCVLKRVWYSKHFSV